MCGFICAEIVPFSYGGNALAAHANVHLIGIYFLIEELRANNNIPANNVPRELCASNNLL